MLKVRKEYFLLLFLFLNGVKGVTETTQPPITLQMETLSNSGTSMNEETPEDSSETATTTEAPAVLAPTPPIPTFLPLHHRYYMGQGHRFNYGQYHEYDQWPGYYDYGSYNYPSVPYRHYQHHSSNRHYQSVPYMIQRHQQYYYQYPEHPIYWG